MTRGPRTALLYKRPQIAAFVQTGQPLDGSAEAPVRPRLVHQGEVVPALARSALQVLPPVQRGNRFTASLLAGGGSRGLEGGDVWGNPTLFWAANVGRSWPWGSTGWLPSNPQVILSPFGFAHNPVGNRNVAPRVTTSRFSAIGARLREILTPAVNQGGR